MHSVIENGSTPLIHHSTKGGSNMSLYDDSKPMKDLMRDSLAQPTHGKMMYDVPMPSHFDPRPMGPINTMAGVRGLPFLIDPSVIPGYPR